MQQTSSERLSLGEWTLRIFVTLLLATLFLAIWRLRDVFLLTFLAIIIATVLQVPVRYLEHLGLGRGISILVAMGGTMLLLALLAVLIAPIFARQITDLANQFPSFVDQAKAEYDDQVAANNWLPKIDWNHVTQGSVNDFLVNQSGKLSRNIFPFLSGVGGTLASIVFMFFITVFFIISPANYLEGLLTLIPRDYRPRGLEILEQLGKLLQRWFIGQLISMAMSGVLIAFVTGVILGLPNAPALGVISGLMEFIPNFGSIVGTFFGLIVAAAKDPVLVPFTLLAYLLTQQIQSNVIMPRIMSRQVSIPAANILIAQIIGAVLFGFMGLLLALPMAIVVMVLVREVYVHDILNARPARLETRLRPDGTQYTLVTAEVYRPAQLTPGAAAKVRAEGQDLFTPAEGQIVEIITPPSPALEQAARGQQAVWLAILALTVAQGLALLRSLLSHEESEAA
jgi:predicted PurR-regulated permease PerM